jgi:hypothetical protein
MCHLSRVSGDCLLQVSQLLVAADEQQQLVAAATGQREAAAASALQVSAHVTPSQ